MNLKNIFIICIVVGIASILVSGVLYSLGGNELFKVQDSYKDTAYGETIKKEETIENIKLIKVKTNVANINFKYTDEDTLKLELRNPIEQSEKPIKINKNKDTLTLDINDVERRISFGIGRNFKSMKDCVLDISIPNKYKGDIDISSDVGNIKGEYAGKKLKLSTDVGNIDVEVNEIESGDISTDVGNVKVKIKEDINLTLDLKTELGKIKNNLKNIKNVNNNSDVDNDFIGLSQDIKLDVNKGGSLIKIKSDVGNISLYN